MADLQGLKSQKSSKKPATFMRLGAPPGVWKSVAKSSRAARRDGSRTRRHTEKRRIPVRTGVSVVESGITRIAPLQSDPERQPCGRGNTQRKCRSALRRRTRASRIRRFRSAGWLHFFGSTFPVRYSKFPFGCGYLLDPMATLRTAAEPSEAVGPQARGSLPYPRLCNMVL